MRRSILLVAALTTTLALTACSSGGSGAETPDEPRAGARRALAVAAAAVGGGDPASFLYARVDGVTGNDDGGVVVIELELTEPSLFLALAPGSLDRFADAIAARVAR